MMQPRYQKDTLESAKKDNRALVTVDIDRRFVPANGKRGGRRTLQAHVGPEMEEKLRTLFNEILKQ